MKDLSNTAVNQFRQNARSMVRELGLLNDAYFDVGVTLAERHLLLELDTCENPTMGEIAQRLLLDKSTISRLIAKALKKDFIECVIDEIDKRRRYIRMTKKGKQTLNSFESIAFKQTKDALLTLTNAEIHTVYQGIALYAKGLSSVRLTQKDGTTLEPSKKIESLAEIYERLGKLGYILDQFTQKDEAGLYEIFREVVDSGTKFPYECSSNQEFHRQFFNPLGKTYVCRSLSGEVIGGFYLKPNFTGRSKHIANAAYMIKDTYRGKGIGSLLIKASLHLVKDLGFQAMQFNMVLGQNTVAMKTYQKLGFSILGPMPEAILNFDGSYQDGYVMYRKLEDLI